jgi:hypothetical protein
MEVKGLIWLQNIVEKLSRKHSVTQQEVRDVFANRPRFRLVEKGHRPGENLYSASGKTAAGRYLIVFHIQKRSSGACHFRQRYDSEGKKGL